MNSQRDQPIEVNGQIGTVRFFHCKVADQGWRALALLMDMPLQPLNQHGTFAVVSPEEPFSATAETDPLGEKLFVEVAASNMSGAAREGLDNTQSVGG